MFGNKLAEWISDELCGVSGMTGYTLHREIKMKNNTDKQITLMGNRWQPKIPQSKTVCIPFSSIAPPSLLTSSGSALLQFVI